MSEKCSRCGELEKEHHYNGACYGKCGEFVRKDKMNESDIRRWLASVKNVKGDRDVPDWWSNPNAEPSFILLDLLDEARKNLTIKQAQENQPWTVPYSPALINAQNNGVHHILASHCVLHAIKSLGKLAAVFEALDHSDYRFISDDELQIVKNMSADLVTAALRFANLYQFDLETVLRERVLEKNGVGY